jgi:hypothetical protein
LWTVCSGCTHEEAEFIVAARNNAERLCDAALYALELERIVHDIQRGEAADLIAEARRLGREEAIRRCMKGHEAAADEFVGLISKDLPPLPAEPPTNYELRERCERLEKENARLRESVRGVVDDYGHSAFVSVAAVVSRLRDVLEATE